MVIQHNIMALNVHRNMMMQSKEVSKSLERLSSGSRINRAADDAAGLAISEKMRGQIRGLGVAKRNAMDAVSMLQTAEGGLNEMHSITQRMRELAVQASNGTYSDEDRALINKEYEALKEEITRISQSTHYNEIKLLDGSGGAKKGIQSSDILGVTGFSMTGSPESGKYSFDFRIDEDGSGYATLIKDDDIYRKKVSGTDTNISFDLGSGNSIGVLFSAGELKSGVIHGLEIEPFTLDRSNITTADGKSSFIFQIGANSGADQQISAHIDNMASYTLGDPSKGKSLQDTNILTRESANEAIGIVEKSINQISSQRAGIGAQINRLGYTINNLETSIENLTAAESSIRDVDMAEEMMNFVKHNIILQAAQAMLAQANNQPNSILQLLR